VEAGRLEGRSGRGCDEDVFGRSCHCWRRRRRRRQGESGRSRGGDRGCRLISDSMGDLHCSDCIRKGLRNGHIRTTGSIRGSGTRCGICLSCDSLGCLISCRPWQLLLAGLSNGRLRCGSLRCGVLLRWKSSTRNTFGLRRLDRSKCLGFRRRRLLHRCDGSNQHSSVGLGHAAGWRVRSSGKGRARKHRSSSSSFYRLNCDSSRRFAGRTRCRRGCGCGCSSCGVL
jgi:hypothetical protein